MNNALIMMGGSGTRFGADIPKQFVMIEGKPVFAYLLEAYERFDLVDEVCVVCHKDWIDFTCDWAEKVGARKVKAVVAGGASRSQSVQFGLRTLSESMDPNDIVLIHDVTHPFIDMENVPKCVQACREVGASTLAGSCFDTMYEVDEGDVVSCVADRAHLVSATAPECFRFDVIYPLYQGKNAEELEKMTSAGAMLIASGRPVQAIRTPLINLKVTLREDMEAFEKLLHGYYYE